MKVLIICVLILGFFSHCLCQRWNLDGTNNNTFDVTQYGARGDGKTDDSQAFLSAWKSTCSAQSGSATLVIPANKNFLVTNLLLQGACKATSINIKLEGNIVAPPKEAWKDPSHWINIEYVNGLTIDGTNSGGIDGDGSTWWQCKSCDRPRALSFHSCNNLKVNGLRISNSPGGHITINGCDGVTFTNVLINSPSTSPNTDGIDISLSKNILIQDSTIHAGDDCIAINGGSSYINATRVACGPGHGISIGSLGKGNQHEEVEEVHVTNCSFFNTTNGARIKTFPGGSGFARKISFEQIQLTNVKNAIIIDQHYGVKVNAESAVQVSDVTYQGFSGTGDGDLAINLKCERCNNIVLNQISIVPSQPKSQLKTFCQNFHGTITSTVPKVTCN